MNVMNTANKTADNAAQATHTLLFELQNLSVHFGSYQALKHVDLKICSGDRLALIGANGSGKSTLLRVLHGLISSKSNASNGRVAGSIQVHASVKQAMLFQRPHMLRMRAWANVALAAWLSGQTWRTSKSIALAALARVGLSHDATRAAHVLSQGQQQRLALARANAMQPNVLLLDEPTASMDPHAKREVEQLMHSYAEQEAGLTLIFASHNLGQVKRLATHVAYMEQGELLVHLPVAEFFDASILQAKSTRAAIFLKGDAA